MTDVPIGILQQRRIEAGVIKPLVKAFEQALGPEQTRAIVAGVIKELARENGRELAAAAPDRGLKAFADLHEPWRRGGALEFDVLKETDDEYHYNVTRCRYAEMYRDLGLADLGYTLSCNRDASLIEGFNPDVEFKRTQTLMQGASHCDFRYRRKR
jgi:hypothetical protein